jgi:hypothetical protein
MARASREKTEKFNRLKKIVFSSVIVLIVIAILFAINFQLGLIVSTVLGMLILTPVVLLVFLAAWERCSERRRRNRLARRGYMRRVEREHRDDNV